MDTTTPLPESPLAEPGPVDIDAVFARDPKSITREERTALIAKLRRDRGAWLEKSARREAKREEKEDAEDA